MTDRALGRQQTNEWYGVVVNVQDPLKSGRVQVRIHGLHDDKTKIPDKDLPWAKVPVPAGGGFGTSLGGKGGSPTGLVVGTTLSGIFADGDRHIPIAYWSYPKAGDVKEGATQNGKPQIDTSKGDVPHGARELDINAALGGKNVIADVALKGAKSAILSAGVGAIQGVTPGIINHLLKVDPSNMSGSIKGALTGVKGLQDIVAATSAKGLANLAGAAMHGGLTGLIGQFGSGAVLGVLKGAIAGGDLSPLATRALNVAVSGMLSGAPPAYVAAQAQTLAVGAALNVAGNIGGAVADTVADTVGGVAGDVLGAAAGSAAGSAAASLLTGSSLKTAATNAVTGAAISTATSLLSSAGPQLASGMISQFAGGGLNPASLTSALNGIAGGAANAALSAVLGGGLGNMLGLAKSLLGGAIGGLINGAVNDLTKTVLDAGKITDTMKEATASKAVAKAKKAKAKEASIPLPPPRPKDPAPAQTEERPTYDAMGNVTGFETVPKQNSDTGEAATPPGPSSAEVPLSDAAKATVEKTLGATSVNDWGQAFGGGFGLSG